MAKKSSQTHNISILNNKLKREIEKRTRAENALKHTLSLIKKKTSIKKIINTVLQSVHKSVDPQTVMKNAVSSMSRNIENADNVSIYMVEAKEAVLKANRGYPKSFIKKVSVIPYPKGFTWETLRTGKLIYCDDTEKDKFMGPAGIEIGTKSYASMPIKLGRKTIGVININSLKKEAFGKEDLNMLKLVAEQIQTALNNARHAEQLQKEKDTAQGYLDISEVIILVLNDKGKVELINKKGCKILGFKHDEIIGRNWFDNFLPQSIKSEVKSVYKKVLQGKLKTAKYYENIVVTKSGRERIITWHNTRLLKDGKAIGTLSSGVDITDLRLAEQRFEQVVESSPNGFVMVNPKGRIVLVNRETEKLFGYHRSELMGQTVEILIPGQVRASHMDYRKNFFLNPSNRAMGEGRDLFAVRKDGTRFPVEIGLSTLQTESGVAVLSSVVDITERKNAEKLVKDNEQKLKAILDSTTDAILVYDKNGSIMIINNQAKKMFSENEKILENISQIIPASHRSIHNFQLSEAENGTNLFDYETERVLSNGKNIHASIALSYIPAQGGMYFESIRDISERVIMRHKIIDFEKAQIIASMAEGIAHHMGTPLASMLLRVQMLKEDIEQFDNNDYFSQKLESIEKQIHYGQKVMQRLLRFASKPTSERVPSNIKNIASDAVEILKPLLNKKRIKLVIDINKDYMILADGNMIQLVFSDLIINSIHAIENEGTIKVTASNDESNDNLTIKISDTGSGIPEEVIPYVFEPFFTTKTTEQGTGLGLAVAKRIVHEHDGEIMIESKKNIGTDIIINLALYKGDTKS